ncbi:MAG: sodium:proton antiporter [Calditrichaeota bacterium]|nr:MAG: sodium:proton antiporter [Calditrichota bacterium]
MFIAAFILAYNLQARPQGSPPHHQTDQTAIQEQASPQPETAGTEAHEDIGSELPAWSVIPFVGILLSIAIFPLVAPKFWHHHFGKVSLFWALLLAIPFLLAYKGQAVHSILEIYLEEYIPFIILLWSLFTVAGGILVRGAPLGTPVANLLLLVLGTFFASWIGTTGAAMVLIRPLLRMNKNRKTKVHLVVFFIFLVANIGGSLTPLGDPPLFLGFLNGVPFFWTFKLIKPLLVAGGILLALFFMVDYYFYHKEGWHEKLKIKAHHIRILPDEDDEVELVEEVEIENARTHKTVRTRTAKMEIKGLRNIPMLLGVIGGVLFSGVVHLGHTNVLGVHMPVSGLVRDVVLILMGLLSLWLTPWKYRKGNDFSWFPIQEVAILFFGIFMTMIPALAMLRAGEAGALAAVIRSVKEPWHYFWMTGALSSFLDNAPTYLTFLSTALGQFFAGVPPREAVHMLIAHQEIYLEAISAGAVFFGAMTYIGNAPNFMVKSIAEEFKVSMPSFFGYMLYSLGLLVPTFLLVTWIFFSGH